MSTVIANNGSIGYPEEVFHKENPCYETVVKKNEARSSVFDHSNNHRRKRLICALVTIITVAILISTCVCFMSAFIEISKLKSEIAHIKQISSESSVDIINQVRKL